MASGSHRARTAMGRLWAAACLAVLAACSGQRILCQTTLATAPLLDAPLPGTVPVPASVKPIQTITPGCERLQKTRSCIPHTLIMLPIISPVTYPTCLFLQAQTETEGPKSALNGLKTQRDCACRLG